MRALSTLAVIASILVIAGGNVDAKKKKKSRGKPNMPPGWTWPPSRAMKQVGDACLDKLDELGVKYKKAKKTRKIATAVVVPDMVFGGVKFKSVWRKAPFNMDCHLALGLETYGQGLYALGVRTVKFSGIHDYRTARANGKDSPFLSRHALGLAMDIKSFVDAAGNEANVLEDYNDGNELLLSVESFINDSGGFRTVLTPRNDPISHDDHFHIEIKVDYTVPTETRRKKPNT